MRALRQPFLRKVQKEPFSASCYGGQLSPAAL